MWDAGFSCRRPTFCAFKRNRRASDYLQAYRRDRQTRAASLSTGSLAIFLWCIVFQERVVHIASTEVVRSF